MTPAEASAVTARCLNDLDEAWLPVIPAIAWSRIPTIALAQAEADLLGDLSSTQIAATTAAQWTALPARRIRRVALQDVSAIDLNLLPPATLRALRRRQIKSLGDEQLRTLKDERAWTFRNEQMLAMSPHQLRMLASQRSDKAKARLKEMEDSQLRAVIALEPGVRLIGDAYAQLQEAATANEGAAESTAAFGVGIDVQEPLWSTRVSIRGGTRERTLDGTTDQGRDAFGLSLLNPQGQKVYVGATSRITFIAGSKTFLGGKTDLHIASTRWKLSDAQGDEKLATTFSGNAGLEGWLPFAQGGNYADLRLFLGLTAHSVGLADKDFRRRALDTARVAFFGPMVGISLRINAIEVHADLRWLQKSVDGLSGTSLITYISFAPGARLASFCHSMSCAVGDKPGAQDLQGADLRESVRNGDTMTGYALDGADLTDAKLIGTNLMLASLKRATLAKADLHGADLRRSDATGASFEGAELGRAKFDSATLERAILSGVKGSEVSLRDARLMGAKLIKADLSNANLSGAKLTAAGGVVVDLKDAILVNANLAGADLTGANLAGADLTGADLSGAELSGVQVDANTKAPTKLDNARNKPAAW
jgi:uncharacterized protein YjbI with pentapeptide repeats